MNPSLIIGYLLLGAAATLTGYALINYQRNQALLRRLQSHHARVRSIVQKHRMDLQEVRNRNKLVEDTVAGGTTAVELVHRTITTVTFEAIDRFSSSDKLKENARRARMTHDEATSQIYRSVRRTNRAIHVLANTVLSEKARKRLRQHVSRKPDRP
ncbi:MAG TPA: hypothetical protein VIN33_08060 [Marinobacter sp.]